MQPTFLDRFYKNLENTLFVKGKRKILIAASGGVDSMVLLHLLAQSNHNLQVAHVNYHLRGEESMGDEQHVSQFCHTMGLAFTKKDIPLLSEQQRAGHSIQMAARDQRYQWLEEIRKEKGFDFIATAHHSNDVVETFFLNLTAGCGIRGLHGIPQKRGNIIRPLLPFTKSEIYNYAQAEEISYREDSSNHQNYYMRNFIRNKILPLFEELNPQFIQTMQSNVQRIKEAEELYNLSLKQYTNQITKTDGNKLEINKNELLKLSFKKSILYELLKDYGFTSGQIEDVVKAAVGSGKNFYAKNHRLVIDRDKIIVKAISPQPPIQSHVIHLQTNVVEMSNAFLRFDLLEGPQPLPTSSVVFHVDYDKLCFPLELRKWKPGDVFAPLGMKGKKKKVKEYFIDNKLNLFEKEDAWILTSQEEVVVLLGHRVDERFKIEQGTKKIYQIALIRK
jgi:tRNA(Ile)-lysidine synthase